MAGSGLRWSPPPCPATTLCRLRLTTLLIMSASAAEHEALIHLHRIGSAADAFDPADPAQVRVLTAVLEETSSLLARDALARYSY